VFKTNFKGEAVFRVGKDSKGKRPRVKELTGLNLSDLEMDMKLQFAISDYRFTRD
jgi:hypothetical protein